MPQQKEVKFDTIYIGNLDGYDIDKDNIPISVEVIPESSTAETVRSILNVNSTPKSINNNIVDDGELCIVMKNQLESFVDFEINDNGELIVHGKNANNYSINDDGELIYTER